MNDMKRTRTLAAWAVIGAWPICGWVQEASPEPLHAEASARSLVDAALRAAESERAAQLENDLDAWAQSVIEGALSKAPVDGGMPPVPAEEHAARVAEAVTGARTGSVPSASTEIIVFMSLSVPEASWRQWSGEAAKIGAPLVLRGVKAGGFAPTASEIRNRLHGFDGGEFPPGAGLPTAGPPGAAAAPLQGAALDPRLFRLFRVAHVPAVAVVPGGVPPCESRGCSSDPVPPHDLVTGNIGLEAALEIIAREGGPGRATARRHLESLRGEGN